MKSGIPSIAFFTRTLLTQEFTKMASDSLQIDRVFVLVHRGFFLISVGSVIVRTLQLLMRIIQSSLVEIHTKIMLNQSMPYECILV